METWKEEECVQMGRGTRKGEEKGTEKRTEGEKKRKQNFYKWKSGWETRRTKI